MRNLFQQAKQALLVYEERGLKVLDMLLTGDKGDVESLLRLRNAAFANFRVYFANLEAAGLNVEEKGVFTEIASRAATTNEKLSAALEVRKDEMLTELANVLKVRRSISKYHSGISQGDAFSREA